MKRRKGGKKKNIKFSNDRKLLAVTIITFFVFAFLVGFVNVGGEATITGEVIEGVGGVSGVGEFFQKWMEGSLDPIVVKYMFFIILTMFIFSILSSAKWPDHAALRWLMAIPVAFVSIAFLTPAQLYAALTTYGALALTLITVLPLAIMFFFSSQLLQGKLTVGKVMFQLILWYFYLAFLLYMLASAIFREGMPFSGPVLIIIAGGMISSCVIFFNPRYRKWVRKIGREITEEVTKDIGAAAEAAEDLVRRHHERNE